MVSDLAELLLLHPQLLGAKTQLVKVPGDQRRLRLTRV